MRRFPKCLPYLVVFILLVGTSGCGGGDASSGTNSPPSNPSFPAKLLTWAPPSAYTDSTPLNPATDLDSFEIYVKESAPFTEADPPLALVSAVDPDSGGIATSFNLANLGPFLSPGIQYQVSLRAVALTGAKSGFSAPASFAF